MGTITFNAIGFGLVFFCFSFFPAADNFPRAAEYGVKTAIEVWIVLALAFAVHPLTSRLARTRFADATAGAFGFAIAIFASDALLGGGDGPFASLGRGAVMGLIVGLLFGSSIFPREEAVATPDPDTE